MGCVPATTFTPVSPAHTAVPATVEPVLTIITPTPKPSAIVTQSLPTEIRMSETPPVLSLTPTSIPYEVIRDVPYITGGNSDQKLNIYLPQRESRHPASLFVLGGPNISFIRHFAKLGYIGIEVYHSEGTTLRAIQNAFCALAWVHANAETYSYDPRYTVVVGTSVLGGQAGELGVIDIPTTYMEDCPYALPEGRWLAGVVTLAGGLDVVNREEIDGSEPPFLIIHGTGDTMIEPQQSEAFVGVLESAGVEVELVLLPDVGHDSILSNQDALNAIEEFLVRLNE